VVYIIYTSRYTPPPLLWICTYPVNILIQRCSAVQLSSAGFSRHPTATTGPISKGGISGHKQEAGLLPHTRPSLLLERYKCTADSAELAKIAQNRVSGCTPTKYTIVSISVLVGGLGTGIVYIRNSKLHSSEN
jgi:hypothetical protein